MAPKAIILMADYGNDPTETAIPWKHFVDAGFQVDFATEIGKQPACDRRMYSGLVGALLGAAKPAKKAYQSLSTASTFRNPLSWENETFTLDSYDLVFLPGGHDKAVRQLIDSETVHKHLAAYFPQTKRPGQKTIAAICHGVQVLAASSYEDRKSVLHDVETTCLVHVHEQGIFHATRLFLGDYYKTYGSGSPSVQEVVKSKLNDPSQFKKSLSFSPFVVEDPTYNYVSARFPPDAAALAKRAIEMVNAVSKASNAS